MPTCARCGRESPAGFRFCGACGAPFEAAPAVETRKVVTVLFSDVAGSTALGERLDPEQVRSVMARYFAEARRIVEHHGGTVEKFVGDAVMAVFGIPAVHEDDALRAVRAADELRRSVHALDAELDRELGIRLGTRTGVNTGEVVAGEGETLATGDAVNVAARLEQAAAPGEVLIGPETHRLVRDAVRVEPAEPLLLKGKAEPVPASRLLAVLPGRPGHDRRLDSPLVGRDRELRLLLDAFEQAVESRTCHLVTVFGPAGVGKSRLARALAEKVGSAASVLSGRCLPYGDSITYWPLVEMAEQVGDEEDAGPLVAAVEAMSAASPEESAAAVRRAFEQLARARPLVVMLDDVHWGEPAFLDLVEHVADWSRDAPLVLVCLARAELLELRSGWGGGKLNALSIQLRPLSRDAGIELVASRLGAPSAPDVARRVVAAAEGNPLFIEELLRALVEDGRLAREGDSWVADGDAAAFSVPPTVQALLAARIDRLPPDERAVLASGAVEGKVFHRGAVSDMTDVEALDDALAALIRKELLAPAVGQVPGEEAFVFRHQLLRDAAYDSLAKTRRAELHERAAGWLGAIDVVAVDRDELVGYHLEQAHSYLSELGSSEAAAAVARRSAERLAKAGHRALARADLGAATTLLRRAVALLPPGDAGRAALLPTLATALVETGDLAEARAVADEATRQAPDERSLVLARVAGVLVDLQSDPERAQGSETWLAGEVIPALERAGDDQALARAWQVALQLRWLRSRAAETLEAAERGSAHARRAGDRHLEMLNGGWIYVTLVFGPTPASEGLRRCDAVLAEKGGGMLEAYARNARSALLAMQGRVDEARADHVRTVALFSEFGHRLDAAAIRGHVGGTIELLADNPRGAEEATRRSMRELEPMGDRSYRSTSAGYLCEALLAQGRVEEGLQAAELARTLSDPSDATSEIQWRTARAAALTALRDLAAAEPVARDAVELAARTDFLLDRARSLEVLGDVLSAAGRRDEARACWMESLELWERKEVLPASARVRERLEASG